MKINLFYILLLVSFFSCNSAIVEQEVNTNEEDLLNENLFTPCLNQVFKIIESSEPYQTETERATKQGWHTGLMLEESPFPEKDGIQEGGEKVNYYQIKFYADSEEQKMINTITRFLFHIDSMKLYDDPIGLGSFDTPLEVDNALIKEFQNSCL